MPANLLELDMNGNNQSQFESRPPEIAPQRSVIGLVLHELRVSIVAIIVLAILVCGIYPAVVWGVSELLFHHRANGSLIGKDGRPVSDETQAIGSLLIGQSFSDGKYFHSRPSAAGNGYDPTASGGSNLGPTSAKLMYGTTKNFAYTVFATDKSPAAVVPIAGRVQGQVSAVTKISITLKGQSDASAAVTYALAPAVADPNTAVNYHGRTVHATTIPIGALVELKLSDKTPPTVTAINVADQETDGTVSAVDTTANKITLSDASGTIINVDPKATAFVINGKPDGKLDGITPNMAIHAIFAVQMDYDGIADRIIHYCQDNNISYQSSVADGAFTDADGVDDMRLVSAFNAATNPSITPAKSIPADAVTASGSGLDPQISVPNAQLQAERVAKARGIAIEKVTDLIARNIDDGGLGVLGDPTVNVLKLNLALDRELPVPATQPAAQ